MYNFRNAIGILLRINPKSTDVAPMRGGFINRHFPTAPIIHNGEKKGVICVVVAAAVGLIDRSTSSLCSPTIDVLQRIADEKKR